MAHAAQVVDRCLDGLGDDARALECADQGFRRGRLELRRQDAIDREQPPGLIGAQAKRT